MAVIQKTLFAENLDKYNTFVVDTDPFSRYFKITELSDTFTGGKNAFLIQGSEQLVADTLIKIEIKDSQGNTIYYEPGEGAVSSSVAGESVVTEYYEGVSKVVAVHIYPDTTFGPCTITILGELSEYYNDSNTLIPIPSDWQGTYNVKWQKQITVNPKLPNTTKIRFYKRPTATITETLSPIYTIVSGSKVESNIVSSFANVNLSKLDTFAGDVKRIKVYRTSEGDISDYDMIQDILVESKELLLSYALTGSVVGEAGLMTSEVLDKLWSYPTLTTELTSSRIDNGVKLNGSGYFTFTSSLNLSQNSVYEFGIDAFYSSSTPSNMGIYVSGSNNGEVLVGTLIGIEPTKNLNDSLFQFSLPLDEPTASLYLSQSQSEWHIGNLSLRLTEDTAFSPSEIGFITSMPTVVGNETYNFKFEFYDVNNNYVPVEVTASALFTGGNNNIGGTLNFISSSASQSLAQLNAVSSSISGTMTVYSSSADTTIVTLSGSVSSSITTLSGSVSSSLTSLSSSVSASNALVLSSSFAQVKNLANGQFSGSFIGDNVIYSPAIGGQQGYIKELFTVGDDTAGTINLDARTTTRKIYIGTGTYNNTNTGFYVDSGGNFSLKDKLTWNGTTLTVGGVINAAGGTFDGNITSTANISGGTITGGTISGGTISGGTISGGTISIGSSNNIFKADSNGIYLGNATFASAPFKVTPAGVLTASNANITGAITATSLTLSGFNLPNTAVGLGNVENLSAQNQAKNGIEASITINSGGIAMGTGGFIRGGQTDYNSGTGFFLGRSGGAYKFSIGDASTKGITWDGSTLTIGGNAVIGASTIATIASNANAALQPGANITSLSNNAGYQDNGSAKTGGSVGGWSIDGNRIFNTNVNISNANSNMEFKDSGGTVRTRIKFGDVNIGSPTAYNNLPIWGSAGGYATSATQTNYNVSAQAYNTSATATNNLTLVSAGPGSKVLIGVALPAIGGYGTATNTGGTPNHNGFVYFNYRITCANTGYDSGDKTVSLGIVYSANPSQGAVSLSLTTGQDGVAGHVYTITTSVTRYVTASSSGTNGDSVTATLLSLSARNSNFTIAAIQSIAEYGTNGASIGSDDGTYVSFGKAAGSGYTGLFTGNVFVGGTLFASAVSSSDKRVKTNILDITNGIQKINALRPVDFEWIQNVNPFDVRKRSYGFIADEVEELFPQLVFEKRNNTIEDFKHLDYQSLHALAIKAIQELVSKIETMEDKLIQLENKISGSI